MSYDIELICDSKNFVAESPTYSPKTNSLYWVDVKGGSVHCLDLSSGVKKDYIMPYVCPFMTLCKDEVNLLVGLKRTIYKFYPATGTLNKITEVEKEIDCNRFNDAKCDPQGRLWFSTMKNNFGDDGEDLPIDENIGGIYCLDKDLSVKQMDSNYGVPNTVAFNPESTKAYIGDSITGELYVYDFDAKAGEIRNKQHFATNQDAGHLDGSAMDEEGCLWNTHWGSSKIVRYSPKGEILEEIMMPVPAPSSCCFGGEDMQTLFVTTARETLSHEQLEKYPNSGGIFAFKTKVRGQVVPNFGGEV